MLYTKYDKESGSLNYICKTCSWTGEYGEDDTCVYKRNYSDDFIASKLNKNRYTIMDPTLPRVSNIKCINEKCLTNRDDIDVEKSVIIKGIHVDATDEMVQTAISGLDLMSHEMTRIGLDKGLVEFKSKEGYDDGKEKLSVLKVMDKEIEVVDYEEVKREVIYIKYDNKNMKYLYICACCNSSWKNS
jgi:hypothetical protein